MATHALPASHIADDAPAAPARPPRPSPMRRLYDAVIESQSRRAEREIARLLGPGGLAALHAKFPPQR